MLQIIWTMFKSKEFLNNNMQTYAYTYKIKRKNGKVC